MEIISARDLYHFLEIGSSHNFMQWAKKNIKNDFIESTDFFIKEIISEKNRSIFDYSLTLNCAFKIIERSSSKYKKKGFKFLSLIENGLISNVLQFEKLERILFSEEVQKKENTNHVIINNKNINSKKNGNRQLTIQEFRKMKNFPEISSSEAFILKKTCIGYCQEYSIEFFPKCKPSRFPLEVLEMYIKK